MSEKRDTRFRPGQSGNRNGRPPKRAPFGPVFDLVFDQRHVVKQNGVERELSAEEALQLGIVKAALAGQPQAVRKVLGWIVGREAWRSARREAKKVEPEVVLIRERDSENAFAAMCLLGIAHECEGGRPPEGQADSLGSPYFSWVKLAPWSIRAAFQRTPSLWEDADLKETLWMQRLHPDQFSEDDDE